MIGQVRTQNPLVIKGNSENFRDESKLSIAGFAT